MLTGQLPFTATDPQELARQHRSSRPIPPGRLNHEIPLELEQIILKVLSKEPAQRYRTADQLGRLLAPFAGFSDALPPIIPAAEPPPVVEPQRIFTPVRAPTRPAAQPQPPQNWSAPAPVAPTAQPQQVQPSGSSPLPSFLSPDILVLAIIAIILWVGIIPFSAYVLLQLGLI
jgi:eukaryotic-like serine/threonine-protein kinase